MEIEYIEPILLEDLGMHYPKETGRQKYRFGLYKCGYCGKEFKAVQRKSIRSCGCLIGKASTHGLKKHRLYKTWISMLYRCLNKNARYYEYYGGRGIKVCEEWLDIKNFISWAEATHIEGLSLDRINNDGNYEPNNCRWADNSTQILNRGIFKNNKSGFVGVSFDKRRSKWCANIYVNKKLKFLGYFNTIEEAIQARDNYIIENNLPHKLSTEYKKE